MSYLIVLRAGIGLDFGSEYFLAALLMMVLYILGGIFLGRSKAARYALPLGLVTTISERLLILAAAAFVLGQFRQVTGTGGVYYVEGGPAIITAIKSEALPYFGWGYIILGVPISIAILYFTARRIEQIRNRRMNTPHRSLSSGKTDE